MFLNRSPCAHNLYVKILNPCVYDDHSVKIKLLWCDILSADLMVTICLCIHKKNTAVKSEDLESLVLRDN